MPQEIASLAPVSRSHNIQIRAVGLEYVPSALLILREASQWLVSRGLRPWSESDLQRTDLPRNSKSGCLILGFASTQPVACMLLQRTDAIYWPEAAEGSALYLHKLAVRRAHAGCGWGTRMIAWAKSETRRQGIRRLRLDTLADTPLAEFYATQGFRLVGHASHPEDGTAMCLMEYSPSPRTT
jgi:GNAT superfamily N-acetyltransferase